MNIILLGAPGAGKGSISEILIKEKHYYHLSTGNELREIAKKKDELGSEVNALLKAGKLVSDDIVNKIVSCTVNNLDKTKFNGIIFDGYPRTKNQAEYLDNSINIDKVLFINVPDKIIEERLVNRRICSKCGKIYNLIVDDLKPTNDNICDVCGGLLMQRKDDQLNVIRDRLKTYYSEIKPLLEHYTEKNILTNIDGTVPYRDLKDIILREVNN